MSTDPFIGARFGSEQQLVVKNFKEYRRGKKDKIYSVFCEVCSKDQELFGDGLFYVDKSYLNRGQIPCGCSQKYHYKDWQAAVMVKRKAVEKGYEFIGFAEPYKGTYTKIRLNCSYCLEEWKSNTVCNILRGIGCPGCKARKAKVRNLTPDAVMVSNFMSSGRFVEGHTFTRSIESAFWEVTCPICSNDEYVQEGLCSGVFTSYNGSLQAGLRPCRCGPTFRWTRSQRELQLAKASSSRRTFVRWLEDYHGAHTKVEMLCNNSEHGVWNGTVNEVLNGNKNCPKCAEYGFNNSKDATLYVIKTSGFTGYGISNHFEDRLQKHWNNFRKAGLEIYWVDKFHMSGVCAQKIEKEIRKCFPTLSQNIEGFKTEATYKNMHKSVLNFVIYRMKEYHIDDPRNNDSLG